MKTKRIYADLSTEEGIIKAEQEQEQLENEGYTQIQTRQTGWNKFISTYQKEKTR